MRATCRLVHLSHATDSTSAQVPTRPPRCGLHFSCRPSLMPDCVSPRLLRAPRAVGAAGCSCTEPRCPRLGRAASPPGAVLARWQVLCARCCVAPLSVCFQLRCVSAEVTSDAFDSPQARGLSRRVRKARAAACSAPRRRRRSGPARRAALPPALRLPLRAARPNAGSRGLWKTRTDERRTMFFKPECRQSPTIYRCTQRYRAMAALGRAAQRPTSGADLIGAART